MNAKRFVKTVSLIAVLVAVFAVGNVFYAAAVPAGTMYGGSGIYPGAASYTVWNEGSTFFAKDQYGAIAFESANASYVLNSCAHAVDPADESDAGNYILVANAEYELDASLLLDVWHVRVEGYGADAPVFKAADGLNTDVIRVSNYSITIKNIAINGNKATQTAGNGINYTAPSTVNRLYVSECSIYNCYDNGIYVGNVLGSTDEQLTVFNCAIWGCGSDGIHLWGNAYDWKIYGCTIASNDGNGIYLIGCAEGAIFGNDLYESSFNILVYQSWGVQITGNHVLDADNDGVKLEESYDVTVSGNTISDSDVLNVGNVGIRLTTANNCTITGNSCLNHAGQTSDAGIYEAASSGDNVIVGNSCSGTVAGLLILGAGSIVEHNSNQTQS